MSRKSVRSSGSRFEALEIEGEEYDFESDSDDSVFEKEPSKDVYPLELPKSGAFLNRQQIRSRPTFRSTVTSSSSIAEMTLSQDNYPMVVPDYYEPKISAQNEIISRSLITETPSQQNTSDIDIKWGFYEKDDQPIEDLGIDALEGMFEQNEPDQQLDIPQNVEQDIPILRNTGFNIDYPGGLLGEGFYGVVYLGYYGITKSASNRFAVKIIDLGKINDRDSIDRRERFETEKYILTNAFHENIVSIRMIINMGDIRSFPFRDNPQLSFLSPQRVYLIMDFADCGELQKYLDKNKRRIQPSQRINWVRDLFAGMLYLHSCNIVHGDVHSGNVLLFTCRLHGLVGKWSDFGLGFVGSDKQYKYKVPRSIDMTQLFKRDIKGMASVYSSIMKDRHKTRKEKPMEKKFLDDILTLIKMMKSGKANSLLEIYEDSKILLEGELNLN